jgi:hypothetical protein
VIGFELSLPISTDSLQISRGVVLHTGSYLRDEWNWIDFVVVVFGWLGYVALLSKCACTAVPRSRSTVPLRRSTDRGPAV